jgi:hypothetical protein
VKSFLLAILMFCSSSSFSQWSMTAGPYDNRSVNVMQFFHGRLYAGIEGGGVFVTQENGDSWYTIGKGLLNAHILSMAVSREKLYIGTQYGVHLLNESDQSWTSLGPFSNYIFALAAVDSVLFAGTSGTGVYRSTDEGTTWVPMGKGLGDDWIRRLVARGNTLLAGTQSHGIYRSTDYGANWTACNEGLNELWIYGLGVSSAGWFASTLDNAYLSTDDGVSWKSLGDGIPPGVGALSFTGSDSLFFAGTTKNGVMMSKDNGVTWLSGGSGLDSTYVESLASGNGYLFAARFTNWIWRRPIAQLTSVDVPSPLQPTDVSLRQNFPNPFNPSTTIQLRIQNPEFIILKVYDLLGREVAVLLEGLQSPGEHQVTWNAGNAASGMYFCRLSATGDGKTVVSTIKMMLAR